MEKKKFKIFSKKTEEDLLYLVLSPEDGKNIEFKAGQFVKITSLTKEEEPKFRFYSIASSPNKTNLEFIIKIVGRFTNHLNSLNQGDELEIEGPYGHFLYNNEKKLILIGGGVGVAPLLSILEYIDEKKIKGHFTLFFSNRTSNFPFKEELDKLNKNSNINIVLSITREIPEDWKGEKRRISKEIISKHVPDAKPCSAFLCGPMKMIQDMTKTLKELGMDEKNIKIEGWGGE